MIESAVKIEWRIEHGPACMWYPCGECKQRRLKVLGNLTVKDRESIKKLANNIADKIINKMTMIEQIKKLRQKYITAELKHYRTHKEKNKTLRAKVSVLTELLNIINK